MRQLDFHCIREDWTEMLRLAAAATETIPAVEGRFSDAPLVPIEANDESLKDVAYLDVYLLPSGRKPLLAGQWVGGRLRLDDENSERLVNIYFGAQSRDGVCGSMMCSTGSQRHDAEAVNKIRNQISDIAKSWRTCLRRVWWISTQITPYSDRPTVESLWVTKNALDWVEHNDSFLLNGRLAAIPHAGIFRQRRLAVLALPTYERSGE